MYQWTFIHHKAPTQVTCAHCQRSLACEASSASRPGHFVVGSRTSYIEFCFRQHPEAIYFSLRAGRFSPTALFVFLLFRATRRRGANSTSCRRFVNTCEATFLPRFVLPAPQDPVLAGQPAKAALRRAAKTTTNPRFVNPRAAIFRFASATPRRAAPSSIHRFRLTIEGPRIVQPVFVTSSPARQLPVAPRRDTQAR